METDALKGETIKPKMLQFRTEKAEKGNHSTLQNHKDGR